MDAALPPVSSSDLKHGRALRREEAKLALGRHPESVLFWKERTLVLRGELDK